MSFLSLCSSLVSVILKIIGKTTNKLCNCRSTCIESINVGPAPIFAIQHNSSEFPKKAQITFSNPQFYKPKPLWHFVSEILFTQRKKKDQKNKIRDLYSNFGASFEMTDNYLGCISLTGKPLVPKTGF